MGHHHLSRREVLNCISVLGSGSLLLPLGVIEGRSAKLRSPGIIRGSLRDGATLQPVAAKLRITETESGETFMPERAIQTMPRRSRRDVKHYFYAHGSYEVALPPGRYRIEVVRGIAHQAAVALTEVGFGITHVHDFEIPMLRDVRAGNWYSGNTHTHYHLELDENPDDRLRLVPPAEALDVSVISYLIRNDSPYITNRYPVGRLPEFSKYGTLVDMGEEARNNKTFGEIGYGHCLFLNIPRLVEPVSTGLLSREGKAPDFPTLSMLCEEAKRVGGLTVWCHNGAGMELPVAVALGHVDAFNVADGLEAEYERYYSLLNCGFRLPASSGTDWWIYDHNRVFVQVEGPFSYDSWIAGLRAGRTFVTNGPLLEFTVNDRPPGDTLQVETPLRVKANVISRLPFDQLQIVLDGRVVAEQPAVEKGEAKLEREISVDRGGWIAARVSGSAKTHAGYPVFAHTSPVYFRLGDTPFRKAKAAGGFIDDIESSVRFIRKAYRFSNEADKAIALGRFEQGKKAFVKLMSQ